MLAVVGLGLLIERLTSVTVVVIPDRPPTAAELASFETSSPPANERQPRTAPIERPTEVSQEPKKVTPPPVIVTNSDRTERRPTGAPAGIIRKREPDRSSAFESRERGESQKSARDYRDLRDYMLNR